MKKKIFDQSFKITTQLADSSAAQVATKLEELLTVQIAKKLANLPVVKKNDRLGNLCIMFSGGTPNVGNPKFYNGEIPFIRSGEIAEMQTKLHLTNLAIEKSAAKFVKKGDLLLALYGATSGAVAISKIDGAINQAVLCIRPNLEKINTIYLKELFDLKKQWILNTYLQGGQGNLSAEIIKSLNFLFPSLPEQKAIAGALGIWDVGIEKLSQVIKLKEKQKKAIMQKLLSGKIRLSGFSKPWKEVKLGEVCEIKKGKQLGRLEMLENGSVPVMNGGILPSGFTNSFNENENTITISEGGNSCGFVSLLKEKFWCGGHCYVLKNLKVEILFLFQILKQKEQEIMRLRVGSGLPNIQKTVIEKFSFYVPADIDEQCAIAGTLSVCDEELALLNKKLALLREQKKSLMQQLLTGKMRLKF